MALTTTERKTHDKKLKSQVVPGGLVRWSIQVVTEDVVPSVFLSFHARRVSLVLGQPSKALRSPLQLLSSPPMWQHPVGEGGTTFWASRSQEALPRIPSRLLTPPGPELCHMPFPKPLTGKEHMAGQKRGRCVCVYVMGQRCWCVIEWPVDNQLYLPQT